MDTGEEKIADRDQELQLRRKARKVHIESVLAATLLTVLCLMIPR